MSLEEATSARLPFDVAEHIDGIGYKYGFEIERILLVPHGGWHNDTICTVEVKTHEGVS